MSQRSDSRVTRRRFLQQGSTVAAGAALVGTATAGPGEETKRDMKYRRFRMAAARRHHLAASGSGP